MGGTGSGGRAGGDGVKWEGQGGWGQMEGTGSGGRAGGIRQETSGIQRHSGEASQPRPPAREAQPGPAAAYGGTEPSRLSRVLWLAFAFLFKV